MDGVELKFQPEALERVAEVALERKTGARGLRGVLENVMTDIMFRIPSDETVCRVEITPGVVDGTGEPVVEHGERTAVPAEKAAEKGFAQKADQERIINQNQYGRGTRFPPVFLTFNAFTNPGRYTILKLIDNFPCKEKRIYDRA